MKDPFHTQNRQLALALITCGCKWLPQEENGPTANTYTPAMLRDKGILPSGQVSLERFEQGVLDAVQAKIAGSVTWFFERTPKLELAIKAWDDNVKLIKTHEKWEEMNDIDRQEHPEFKPIPYPDISDETVMQVLNFHANNTRIERLNQFIFANPAICSTIAGTYTPSKQPKTSTDMPAGVTTGKGKAWSVTLSNADREHIGLHRRIK